LETKLSEYYYYELFRLIFDILDKRCATVTYGDKIKIIYRNEEYFLKLESADK